MIIQHNIISDDAIDEFQIKYSIDQVYLASKNVR